MRRLVYYVASSLDGFIADEHGSAEAFPQDPATIAALFDRLPETCPAHLREVLGVTGEARRFDAVVMGRRTHQPALDAGLTSAYPHLDQYVVTHRDLPDDPTVTAVDDPVALVRSLKAQDGMDVWLCGGGDLAAQLLDEIDEVLVKVNPVLLGDGVRLAATSGSRATPLRPGPVEQLPGGVLLASYSR